MFTEHLADKTKPLRDLLSKKNSWTWGHAQESAFREIKECLISPPVLTLYDMNRKTKVSSDASKYGIGCVVLQEQDNGFWKPIAFFLQKRSQVWSHIIQQWRKKLLVLLGYVSVQVIKFLENA